MNKENDNGTGARIPKMKPKGIWALILGGSSGLGLATAKKLAREGFHVIIVHRDRKIDLQHIEYDFKEITLNGVQFKSFNVDAVNRAKLPLLIEDVKALLSPGERVGVLVHSIAKGHLKPIQTKDSKAGLEHQDFQMTIHAMALSLYDWTKALVDAGLFADDSRIISFTSEGNTKAWKGYAAVSAAKVTLEAITRNIALEYAPFGIKANCIQAGVTDTPSLNRIPGSELLKKNAMKRNPSGRLTMPEDVANAVYLLTTPEAKWITGTVIKVDGGESLQ